MISTTRLEKLYGYKKIYNKVYIVCLNNGKIIRIRNVRFYEKGVLGGSVEEEAFFEAIFDKETEEFTFGIVCFKTTFGFSESLILRISITLWFQKIEIQTEPLIDEPIVKERIMQSNLPFLLSTSHNPIDEAISDDFFRNIEPDEVRNIEFKSLQVLPKEKKVDNTLGDIF